MFGDNTYGRPSLGDVAEVPDIAEDEIMTHRTDEREAGRAVAATAAAAAASARTDRTGDRGEGPVPPLVVPTSQPLAERASEEGRRPGVTAREVRPEQLWNVDFGSENGWDAPTALLTIAPVEKGEWLYARPMLKGEARFATTVYSVFGEPEDVVFERQRLPDTTDRIDRALLPKQKVLFDFSATRGDTVALEELVDKCPEHLLPHHLRAHQKRRKSPTPPGGTPREAMTLPPPPRTSPRARLIPQPPLAEPKTGEGVDPGPPSRSKEGVDPDPPSQRKEGKDRDPPSTSRNEGVDKRPPLSDDRLALRRLVEAQTAALEACTAKLTKESEGKNKHTDLRSRPLELVTRIPEPSGQQLLDMWRIDRWWKDFQADMKGAFVHDYLRFCENLHDDVTLAQRNLAMSHTGKMLPHQLYAQRDAESEAASAKSGTSIMKALMKGRPTQKLREHQPNPKWKNERDAIIDGMVAAPLKNAMTSAQQFQLVTVFGANHTTKQALYVIFTMVFQGTKQQRKAMREDFPKFEMKPAESVFQGLERFREYGNLMAKWSVALPDVGDGIDLIMEQVDSRMMKLPESTLQSLRTLRMEVRLDEWTGDDWEEVWLWTEILQELVAENPIPGDFVGKEGKSWDCGDAGDDQEDCPEETGEKHGLQAAPSETANVQEREPRPGDQEQIGEGADEQATSSDSEPGAETLGEPSNAAKEFLKEALCSMRTGAGTQELE